jgi:hypothetical protein
MMIVWFAWFIVFYATFNNISVISWWSVVLMEETGVPTETTDLSQVTDQLYYMMLYIFVVHLALSASQFHNIGGDSH